MVAGVAVTSASRSSTARSVADVASTMPRSLRIPDELWRAAVAKAREEGTTVTAVVVAALTRYVGK